MESEMLQSPLLGLGEEDEADLTDWNLPLAFMKKRHCEKIEGSKSLAQSWRMKDRMKTVSVALVLCLNVGVDPPDVVKTTPCARLECWIGVSWKRSTFPHGSYRVAHDFNLSHCWLSQHQGLFQ
uniref:Regulatory associated protein of MTOR complex 1 n=1 Tax=Ovis aries TaxID=9940 RepID=A0AC11D7R0_SHEEP